MAGIRLPAWRIAWGERPLRRNKAEERVATGGVSSKE